MVIREIQSKVFGNLGTFQEVAPGLFRSSTGSSHVLGSGNLPTKAAGVLLADSARTLKGMPEYNVPRTLVLCSDFPEIASQPYYPQAQSASLSGQVCTRLFEGLATAGLSGPLAIRSASPVEDQALQAAAGKFRTEFHGRPLDSVESRQQFLAKLLAVYNSAYAPGNSKYWISQGFKTIPPLSIIIQELVGNQWAYAPRYFLPAIAGIVNTASRQQVKVNTVYGLGTAAVDGFGAGILHRFPISRKDGRVDINQKKVGEWNDESIYALDQETGNLVRLTGKDALALFPEEFSSKIDYAAPSVQMHMANVGLFLEHRLGFPVDLEFATDQELSESLLQIRPISKRPRVAQPNVHPYDLLLSSGDVIGYGKVNFDYILYVKCPDGAPSDLSDIIAALSQKYPRSLVIYSTRVVQMATERAIEEDLFPHVQAVICNDIDYTAHSHHASTMSHMALNLANEHKIFMSTSGGNANRLLKMLKTQGILDERFRPTGLNGEYRSLVEVKVYHFNVDVQMAADDDFGWGMLYLVDDYS